MKRDMIVKPDSLKREQADRAKRIFILAFLYIALAAGILGIALFLRE